MKDMNFIEIVAKEFADNMPKHQIEKFHKLPAENQEEFAGLVFDAMQNGIKDMFKKYVVTYLKGGVDE